MKCALIIKYYFRQLKIDSKHSFPVVFTQMGENSPGIWMGEISLVISR
eukprot:UN13026